LKPSLLGNISRKIRRLKSLLSMKKDGIIINIYGARHHKTTLQQDIIRDQQSLQIGEVTTTIHGIKGKKKCNN
jgi:hypothetical protein